MIKGVRVKEILRFAQDDKLCKFKMLSYVCMWLPRMVTLLLHRHNPLQILFIHIEQFNFGKSLCQQAPVVIFAEYLL